MRVLIIVPAYNEMRNLPALVDAIHSYHWECLIVNDCSSDETESLLIQKGWQHLNLPVNAGLASVTQMGFRYAYEHDYDVAMVVDGDGQHPPRYISKLVDEIKNGYDYVVGSRYITKKKPFTPRMIGSRLICFSIKLKTGRTVSDPTSGMRALGKNILAEFSDNMNYIAEPDALCHILKKGYKVKEMQVDMEERAEGKSYFHNPLKSFTYMFNVLMSIWFLQ